MFDITVEPDNYWKQMVNKDDNNNSYFKLDTCCKTVEMIEGMIKSIILT